MPKYNSPKGKTETSKESAQKSQTPESKSGINKAQEKHSSKSGKQSWNPERPMNQ